MGNRKDIGKVFNERFRDFEQAPSADLWDTIASGLDQKNDRRIAPLWLYFGGFLIVGMLTGLLYWAPWDALDSIKTKEQPLVINTDTITQDEKDINPSKQKEKTTNTTDTYTINNTTTETTTKDFNNLSNTTHSETTITNNALASTTDNSALPSKNQKPKKSQSLTITANTSKNTKNSYNKANSNSLQNKTATSISSYPSYDDKKAASNGSILNTMVSTSQKLRNQKELEAKTAYEAKIKEELARAIAAQKEENKIALQKWQDSLLSIEAAKKTALAVTSKTEDKTEVTKAVKLPKTQEERENDRKESVNYKLAISPYTSILSYGSLSKGSSIDNRLVDNPRDAVSTIGYGIRADYKLSEKSSIRFGIGTTPLRYRTDDFQVLITNNNVNIFQLSGIDPQNLNQSGGGGIETSPEALTFFNANDVVSIEQDISYIEIPVDYQYRFLNKRVSMSFNTGLSLFVLTNNKVFATANNGQNVFIGRETSLKDLSVAFNLGLGTYYNFSKKWRFDLEPAFKYQLNPYSDNIGNFRPYYFGLQFGMSYKF